MLDLKTNPSTTLRTGVLCYGDNLEILRDHIPAEAVDLVYLHPPFNSQQQYNVLFKEPTGQGSTAQIRAFTDTWHWDTAAERTCQEIIEKAPLNVAKAIEALRNFIGSNDVMAYLVMMTLRLVELHRVLKSTGSLYLHFEPTASHYREMKAVIGDENLGLFITLEPPTEPMRVEAATAGFHSSPLWERQFPRIQIFTVAELLDGKPPELPGRVSGFARAPRLGRGSRQIALSESAAE